MNKTLMAMVAAAAVQFASAQSVKFDEGFRQAVQGAMQEAEKAIGASQIPSDKAVAILPVDGDTDGWIAGQLKIALTAAGKTCVEGRQDPVFGEILGEITWDSNKEDVLAAATVDRFGRLKSAQVLMSAAVRSFSRTPRYVFFEMELHATDISSKQHIWGGVFAKRYYYPGEASEEKGPVDIPVELRGVMQGKFRDAIVASIKGAPKLAGVKKVAFLPFAGDNGDYAANIVRDAIARTDLTTVNLDISTLGEARLALRDRPDQVDALLRGSLRDLSVSRKPTTPDKKKFVLTAEIQACIESAVTREQLWSDTICVSEEYSPEYGWWDMLCDVFPQLRASPWLAVAVPLGALFALIALCMVLRAMTRVR